MKKLIPIAVVVGAAYLIYKMTQEKKHSHKVIEGEKFIEKKETDKAIATAKMNAPKSNAEVLMGLRREFNASEAKTVAPSVGANTNKGIF